MKLAVIILDAVGADGARSLGMKNLMELYRTRYGNTLTCSSPAHTAVSNELIWSGEVSHRYWVRYIDDYVPQQRVDPAVFFDRDNAAVKTDRVRLWTRQDYPQPFLWDLADAQGLEAVAYDVPFILPPHRFNAPDAPDTDNWFPDTMKRCEKHVREAVNYTLCAVGKSPDLFCTSIQVPDKWWHGLATWNGGTHPEAQKFVEREAAYLDEQIPILVEAAENAGMEWVIMGDHGPPRPGALIIEDVDGTPYVLAMHHKHSMIVSSLEPPSYTEDLFPWFCNILSIDPDGDWTHPETGQGEGDIDVVTNRLENLGYI